jgi:hypothetical protein
LANSSGFAHAAKLAALSAIVDAKSIKAALYLATATTGPSNTAYTATGEVSGTGYTAGGVAVTNATSAAESGGTAYWTPSASIAFGTVTLASAFDAVMLYDTGATNRNLGVFTFGSQTVTAAPFTLTMPTNDATTGLLRIG